eukprot:9469139-Pyramimonas_sp.AAC.2
MLPCRKSGSRVEAPRGVTPWQPRQAPHQRGSAARQLSTWKRRQAAHHVVAPAGRSPRRKGDAEWAHLWFASCWHPSQCCSQSWGSRSLCCCSSW